MNKNIFFILPILFIIFSAPSFSSQDVKAISLHPTTTTITPNPATATLGKAMTFHAKVADHTLAKNIPNGTVTWSDGGKGGIFNSTSCTLAILSTSESTCAISYTPSTVSPVTINGTYGGDSAHVTSSGTTPLTVTLRTTSTTVTPNPATTTIGRVITFSAKVNDPGLGTTVLPTGTVTWSDGGKGGIFNSTSCTLAIFSTSESLCYVTYTQSTVGLVTINGTYGGDSSHVTSSGITSLSVTLRTTSTTVTPNPATTAMGKAITFSAKVNDPGLGTAILPAGTVTWSDGGKGGIFNSTSCTLASFKGSSSVSICYVTYTQSTIGPVTINGTYGGDSSHVTSSGITPLKVTSPTTTAVTGPAKATIGKHATFTAKVSDSGTGTKTLPTGPVTWSDGGKGGIFSSSSCTLVSYKASPSVSTCSVTYTGSIAGSVTITGTYGGDSGHAASLGKLGIKVS